MPEPAEARSSTVTEPVPSLVRSKAVAAPMTPAPTMSTSAAALIGAPPARCSSAAPAADAQVSENLARRVVARRAGHPAARVRPRAAQEQAVDRSRIPRPAGYRPHVEQLVEPDVAVEDVALGQPVRALQVQRRQDLASDDGGRHVRGERADPREPLVA